MVRVIGEGIPSTQHVGERIGGGAKGETLIVGIINEKANLVSTRVLPTMTNVGVRQEIAERVKTGAWIHTDEESVCWGLNKHGNVNHAKWEWTKGDVLSNPMKSFWSMVKRGSKGVYHVM